MQVDYFDIEFSDENFFNFLQKYVIKGKVDLEHMGQELFFDWDVSHFGVTKTIELVPNGRNIQVNDTNKMSWVKLVTQYKMCAATKPQIESFLEGFFDIIPVELISIFSPAELELLICGLEDIDVDDLRENTSYEGYNASDDVITWFWEVVEGFSPAERSCLLHFVTSSTRVPPGGFRDLKGSQGDLKPFTIKDAHQSSDMLPSSHTCFNHLDLPRYNSKEELSERLTIAIREGKEGFGAV